MLMALMVSMTMVSCLDSNDDEQLSDKEKQNWLMNAAGTYSGKLYWFDKNIDKTKYPKQVDSLVVTTKMSLDNTITIYDFPVKLFFKSERDVSELQEAERQNLEAQLAYLRYQVNPHFYMNTLNNIHALVDIDPERAKTTVVELSKMMRYILYDGERNGVSLKREIQFLDNYVRLMRLRYTSSVRIDVEAPETVPDRHIPPLVLIIFVENAFKHGISYSENSFVEVKVAVNGECLVFCCRNSKHHNTETDAKGGVGLVNVKRRLDLLYGDRYALDVDDSDGEYGVRLELPFLENEDF